MVFENRKWVFKEKKIALGQFNSPANANCRNTLMFFAEIDEHKHKTGLVMHINVNENHKNMDLLKCNDENAIYQNFKHLSDKIFSPFSKPIVVGSLSAVQLF